MTLDEAFDKYPDDTHLRRKKYKGYCYKKSLCPQIEWLKQMKKYATPEAKELGFAILPSMIEDANADDWEVVE